jgi:hypothetical protein
VKSTEVIPVRYGRDELYALREWEECIDIKVGLGGIFGVERIVEV